MPNKGYSVLSRPLISVIIPLYNKEKYIKSAIESVLTQNADFHEIIVVDDGSTDAGPDMVKSITDPRVRVIRQPNAGPSAARNTGIVQSSGDYLAFLDADDLYLDGFLSTIMRMIELYPQAGIYATSYFQLRDNSFTATPKATGISPTDDPQLLDDFFRSWRKSSLFSTSSVCIRLTALREKKIKFPVGERLGEDQEVWFRLAEEYPVAYCRRPLSAYNTNVSGSLTSGAELTSLLPCYIRLAERVEGGRFPERYISNAKRLVSCHYLNVARSRLVNGDRRGAMQLISDPRAKHNLFYRLRCLLALWFIPLLGKSQKSINEDTK
jgi:glycosyltransferase involved in cell wall biosynthesis